MSPRRRIEADTATLLEMPPVRPVSRVLPVLTAVGGLVMATAVSVSAVVFNHSADVRRETVRSGAAVDFVSSFITQYTSPDPFNANAYADKILARGTGDFAKFYSEKMNEIVVQVARAEPGQGSVQSIGVERWNDDGSADVVAVSSMITTFPDGRKIATGSRWLVTATKEGDQWKVSKLIQVI
jgi:Mce-associated membrane protein